MKLYDRKNYQWRIPLLSGLCIILVGLLVYKAIKFSDIVLVATFVSILWYSFETKDLKIATQKQLEPIPFLHLDKSGNYLELSNVGKTPISNLIICPVEIKNSSGNCRLEFNILKLISHIISGENCRVEISRSFNSNYSARVFHQQISNIITTMREANVKKIELTMQYDTIFQINEQTKFIFEIPEPSPDNENSTMECRIYLLPK